MSHRHPQVTLSVAPEYLEFAAALDIAIELKFDWEHTGLLTGRTSLRSRLDGADVDPEQVRSVHLPPGTVTRGDDIGMAATEANRGTIVDFVQSQLDIVPDAHLVLHPPKQFAYASLLSLLGDLCRLTERGIAIENTPVESYWHTPEDMAFFAYAGAVTPSLDSLYLTVDSAHVPPRESATAVDHDRVDTIVDRLHDEPLFTDSAVGAEFRAFIEERLENTEESMPTDLPRSGWTKVLNALCLTGDRVREVHLNDPVNDGIPNLLSHQDAVREAVLSVIQQQELTVVIEPGRASREEIRTAVPELIEWIGS